MIAIMSDRLSDRLRAAGVERRFGAGAFLFHRGDTVALLYLVLEGEIHLLRHQEDGATLVQQRAGAGALLAEASLFAERYHCDAVAVTETATLAVPKQTLQRMLADEPALAQAFAAHLAGEVQAARLRAEILSLRTVAARLDAYLSAGGDRLPDKGRWKTLAAELGTTPEALYRELARRRKAQGRTAPSQRAEPSGDEH